MNKQINKQKAILLAIVTIMLLMLVAEVVNSEEFKEGNDFKVTLLGTGGPLPFTDRFSASTLVQVGDKSLLIDAGRGVFMRIWQMGLTRGDIDAVFITHQGYVTVECG